MLSERIKYVFEQLIPIYEKAIVKTPKDKWWTYIYEHNLNSGICYASVYNLREVIDKEMKTLTDKFVPGTFYWYDTPAHVHTYEEVIDCLQWRVDKMKSMLNQ